MSWQVVRADNPGPMTLEGTNTYVVGVDAVVVVDPGPLLDEHLRAVRDAVAGRPVEAVVLTHRHLDHSEGAQELAGRLGRTEVLAEGAGLTDGLALPAGLTVLATPGHTADSVSLLLDEEAVLTGDTILGRGTSVVAHPDGALTPYLASLARLQALGPRVVLPGHGPQLPDLGAVATAYLEHRAERLAQVRAAVEGGAVTAAEVVEIVYADVDPVLWPAAERSVAAQLEHLAAGG